MIVRHLPALALASAITALAGSPSAEVVTGTFSGTVRSVGVAEGAQRPGAVAIGDAFLGCFRYDTEDAEARNSPIGKSHYYFRSGSRSRIAFSIADSVWRSGDIMRVAVYNDDHHLGDIFQINYDRKDLQYRAGFNLILKGFAPSLLRSTRLPVRPDDLVVSSSVFAGGLIYSTIKLETQWSISLRGVPLSLRINGEPVPGAEQGPSRDKAALEAEALCVEQVS